MRKLLFGFFAILCNVGFSEIVTIHSLEEADLRALSYDSLVLFDVDEVLVTPADVVLRPPGRGFAPKCGPVTEEHAGIMLNGTQYVLLDESAPTIIQELQEREIPTIAFTACRTGSLGVIPSMEDWRFEQLKNNGIDFQVNPFYEVTFPQLAEPNPPKFDRGILFCGDFYHPDRSTKGELLGIFLDEMEVKPESVVFFDDDLKNLTAVEEELMKRDIPFKGYHLQSECPPLNEETAQIQYKTLVEQNKWLSDKEVANLRAVVFDFGGVMTLQPNREAVIQFICKTFALSPEEFETVNRVKKQALKAGISDEEFWLAYALEKGIELDSEWPTQLKAVMKNALGANPEMFQLVDRLKAQKVPVALLSNIDERLAKLVREFGYYDPFEPCLLSCEIEIKKPDPKAYEYLIEKLGVPAAQIVFIDDLVENIESAQTVGLDAIHFVSFEQIQDALIQRGFL